MKSNTGTATESRATTEVDKASEVTIEVILDARRTTTNHHHQTDAMADLLIFCTTCMQQRSAEKIEDPNERGHYVNRCRHCGTKFGAPPPRKPGDKGGNDKNGPGGSR